MVPSTTDRLENAELRVSIHRRLVGLLEERRSSFLGPDPAENRLRARFLINNILDTYPNIPPDLNRDRLTKEVIDQALGLGPLEDFLADTSITEIMINGPERIYVERAGQLHPVESPFSGSQEVQAIIDKIVAPLGRRIDESSPLVDARLRDGSRVNAIIPPLALNGPCLTIRKFRKIPFTPVELIENGTLTAALLDFLGACVKGRCNIMISGGTGSGKTTLLNLLASFIPSTERIVTIEDAAELRLPQEHVVSLESRPANLEGRGEITIRQLVRNALRMRPDRIVVGECRGGEALDMLQAMNTGHDGSLTTGHANDTRDMLLRLETLVLMSGVDLPVRAIREQIASAIDLIVQVERLPSGLRKVSRISEICGMEGDIITLQDLYRLPDQPQGQIQPTGMIPRLRQRLMQRGVELPLGWFQRQGH